MPRWARSAPSRTLLATHATLLLLVALCTAGCAATPEPAVRRPISTPTVAPLARTMLYWSTNTQLLALLTGNGQERWHVGNWTGSLPVGGGYLFFGPEAPVAEQGMLFATSFADHTTVPSAYSFDPIAGSIRWHTPLAGCFGYPVTAPLATGGVLYIAMSGHSTGEVSCGPSGWVFALRETDGAVLWRKPFANLVFPSLALTDGVLVVGNTNYPAQQETTYLTGLRAVDGTQLWQVQRLAMGAAFTAADGVVVLSRMLRSSVMDPFMMYVEALRAADGARLWQATLEVHVDGFVAISAQGLVYVHSDLGYLYALRLADGSTAWRFPTHVSSIGTPALVNGDLYFGSGPQLVVLNAATGTPVRTYALLDSSPGTAGAASYVYAWTQPVLSGGAIFVAEVAFDEHPSLPSGILLAFDQASGRILWQRVGSPSYSAPVAIELPMSG